MQQWQGKMKKMKKPGGDQELKENTPTYCEEIKFSEVTKPSHLISGSFKLSASSSEERLIHLQ